MVAVIQQEAALVDSKHLRGFIADADRILKDPELIQILQEIADLVDIVRARLEQEQDPKKRDKLVNLEKGTVSHAVEIKWVSEKMGFRELYLTVRDYVRSWIGLHKSDTCNQVQIGLEPRPSFLVGKFHTNLWTSNGIPGYETLVSDPREVLDKTKGQPSYGDSPLRWFGNLRIFGTFEDLDALANTGKTPLQLIAEFRDSLKAAVEHLLSDEKA